MNYLCEHFTLYVQSFMKNKNKKHIKNSFQQIKTISNKQKKKTELFNRITYMICLSKQKQFLKFSLNQLYNNMLHSYNENIIQYQALKKVQKDKSSNIISFILSKLYKKTIVQSFKIIKVNTKLNIKILNCKTLLLISRLESVKQKKIQCAFNQISKNNLLFKKKQILITKLTSAIKNKIYQIFNKSFNMIKINNFQPQEIKNKQNTNQLLKTKHQSLKIQLKNLQTTNKRPNPRTTKIISDLQQQISKLKQAVELIKLSNNQLDSKNDQIQRELLIKQNLISKRKKITANKVWVSIYDHFIYFFTINKNKSLTKQQLLQSLQIPLSQCRTNQEELIQQNNILSELCDQYQKYYPEPEIQENDQSSLPFSVLKNENNFYYLILEVLAQWGANGSKQLEELNQKLEIVQKK